ncbi:MAG: HDIG domain-containing protein [Mobilitalea sp.]
MKTDDVQQEKEQPVESKPKFMLAVLPFISMLIPVLLDVFYQTVDVNTFKMGIITLLLTAAVSFYIKVNASVIWKQRFVEGIVTIAYLAGICLLLILPNSDIYCFWMIGSLLISLLIDLKLGILVHFNLAFLLGISVSQKPEVLIQILITGLILNMLSDALKKKSTFLYAAIIILSTHITLSFALNNLVFEVEANVNYFLSLTSLFFVILAGVLLYVLYDKNIGITTIPSAEMDKLVIPQEEAASTQQESLLEIERTALPNTEDDFINGMRTSYEVLCDPENDLLKQLREFDSMLYEHALHIGDISKRAASSITANEMLAYAGGLYHEAGKMRGKNYIEEGLILADEYAFPKELKAIIREHNIKYDKPNSVEAAIVMITDSVVSTLDYIEKTGDKKFTATKVIDNIFQMRMDKGTFDAAGLSLKDYKILKEFYHKEFVTDQN